MSKEKKELELNNEVEHESLGKVDVIAVTENEDGSSDMELDVDDAFLHRYLQITGRTEIIEEEVAEWILEKMKSHLEEEEPNKEDEESPASDENAK